MLDQKHNNPPDPLDEALAPYADYIAEAEGWLDGQAVTDEGQMKAVDALLKEIKSAEKAVKNAEESEAKPIYDQWKAAKARFTPTLDDIGRLKKGLADLVNDFKKKLAAEKAEAERLARIEAEKAAREAEEAARKADSMNIEEQRAAAEKMEAARQAQEAAKAASKDQVKGLRTVTKYAIDDHRAALHWIAQNDREAVTDFIDEYVRKNHRTKTIGGVRVWQDKEAF